MDTKGADTTGSEGARVTVRPMRAGGENGYDIVVNSQWATAGDYIEALNQAVLELPLDRGRDRGLRSCRGCDLCCRERLPITSVDVRILMDATGERDLYRFLGRYAQVVVNGRTVDITMARDAEGCAFLDPRMRQCREYDSRPLACQTFICCPLTRRAESLRDILINTGEDELVRWWLSEADGERRPVIHEGSLAGLSGMDVPATPYSGREGYHQVLLKEVCPAELWNELRAERPGERDRRKAGSRRRGR
ncbi:MAG: YkgJ family cysteine cluster protein [Firmicutes bacterium]|nr:YkgJ family cysteine cluster protein [Bacillota bacterium]